MIITCFSEFKKALVRNGSGFYKGHIATPYLTYITSPLYHRDPGLFCNWLLYSKFSRLAGHMYLKYASLACNTEVGLCKEELECRLMGTHLFQLIRLMAVILVREYTYVNE